MTQALLSATLLLAPAVQATPPPAQFFTIDRAISAGKTVEIDTATGQTRKGKVFAVTPAVLELLSGGQKHTIPVSDISLVRVVFHDPVTDGAKRGVLTGLAIGASLGLAVVVADCADGHRSFIEFCSSEGLGVSVGVLGAYGAGIGVVAGLIGDALIPTTRVVWRSPALSPKVAFAGIGVRGGGGARMVIRW
jgi:hypothetical protein